MHIAFWSPAWPLERFHNGIVTYVHWMKRGLETLGHRVSVFTPDLNQGVPAPDVHYTRERWRDRLRRRLSRPADSSFAAFDTYHRISAEILKVHKSDPIDVIDMEESFGWFAGVARETSLPVVVRLHGPAFLSMVEDELTSPLGREKIVREGTALESARVIAAPSNSTLAQTIERYRLHPRISAYITNPLTMPEETPLWSLTQCNPNLILFVGRFDLRKGADIVLKAFELVSRERPDVRLIMVGPDSGIAVADGRKLQFDAYCHENYSAEFRDRVEFRGPMSNPEIAALRTQALVTLVAARWENCGYALLEAMFQGCPVVSTDAGGCPEIVTNELTGRIARSENPSAFAAGILAMLDDPRIAEQMGRAARAHILHHYSATTVAAESIELYKRAISDAARSTGQQRT